MVLDVDHRGDWLLLRLNRPDSLNSLTIDLHKELLSIFESSSSDTSIRSILLTGSGKAFCAGQDLNEDFSDLSTTLSERYNPLVKAIRSSPKPIVCAVNGVAAGAGANLAFCCDIVLASKSARFIQSFSQIGLIPDSGGTWLLPRLIGEHRAKALCFTGDSISADEAKDLGLVWKVYEDSDLQSSAEDLVTKLSSGATYALGLCKRAIHESHNNTLESQLSLEASYQGDAGSHPDFSEGIDAFRNKRAARFKGV